MSESCGEGVEQKVADKSKTHIWSNKSKDNIVNSLQNESFYPRNDSPRMIIKSLNNYG